MVISLVCRVVLCVMFLEVEYEWDASDCSGIELRLVWRSARSCCALR